MVVMNRQASNHETTKLDSKPDYSPTLPTENVNKSCPFFPCLNVMGMLRTDLHRCANSFSPNDAQRVRSTYLRVFHFTPPVVVDINHWSNAAVHTSGTSHIRIIQICMVLLNELSIKPATLVI